MKPYESEDLESIADSVYGLREYIPELLMAIGRDVAAIRKAVEHTTYNEPPKEEGE